MEREIGVAVVGCGYWGPNLIRNFQLTSGCLLRSVCDKNETRLAHMKRLYPSIGTCADVQAVFADPAVDAVAIATPVHLHHPLAKQCLAAGKHTFIEKPMAATVAQCEELVRMAEARRLTLMVGHTFLYSPPVRKIREIVDSGDIGDIRYISSRRLNLGIFQEDINVVWDLAPHDLSIILSLMKDPPTGVNCQGAANVNPKVEDVCSLSLAFAKGGFATVHTSWLDPKKVREMTIVGTRKMIVYDDLEPLQKIRVYDTRVDVPPHYDTFAQFQYAYHYGDMWAPYMKQEEPLRVECSHFVDCIRNGTTPLSSGRDGLDLVRILEAATESLRNEGKRVRLDGSN